MVMERERKDPKPGLKTQMVLNEIEVLTQSPIRYVCVRARAFILFACFDVVYLGLHLLLNSFFSLMFSNLTTAK